jgi:hypothetical protein
MDGDLDTKQIESGHFKYFRQLLADFPEGEVWHEDEPDFLVHSSNGVLGIEHRQLFQPARANGPPLQAFESQIDEIVSLAQEHAELRGMAPVHVGLFFSLTHSLTKEKRLALARAIARFIYENLPRESGSLTLEYDTEHKGDIPEGLDLAIITRSEHGKRHHWQSSEAGQAVRDCREILQSAIDDKADKITNYLKVCDACWLLVASDGLKPSSFIHADQISREYTYSSPFERTYFLDSGCGDLMLLRTAAP